jgi:hypothetical protein
MILLTYMDQLVFFQITSQSKSLVGNITHISLVPCVIQLVFLQVTSIKTVLVAHITHMFVAGHCSTLMTVGWAWLGSRVSLTRKFWQRVLFIFFVCLKQQKKCVEILPDTLG